MATLSDITLTNILAATTAPYWMMKPTDKGLAAMSRAPLFNHLRQAGRVITTDTFKTGLNLMNQTVSSVTELNTLEVSLTAEKVQMPGYIEYNMVTLNKLIKLTGDDLKLLEKSYNPPATQSMDAKARKAAMRKNVEKIGDQIMLRHFRVFNYDIERRLFGLSGSNFYGLTTFLNPSTGPSTSIGTGSQTLADLDVTVDRPLYVTASGGTGATGLGPDLTGSASIGYNEMMQWHTTLIQTQMYRKKPYNITVVSPKVYQQLAAIAERRITYNAPHSVKLPMWSLTSNNGSTDSTVPLYYYSSAVSLNGLPVLASPSCPDNYVWLLNTEDINIEIFQDEYANDIYKGEMKETEGIMRLYTRRLATTLDNWNDDALVLMRSAIQMSLNDVGCLAVIEFDSTSTS